MSEYRKECDIEPP